MNEQPAYVVIEIPSNEGDEFSCHGLFMPTGDRSTWRAARRFVEDNFDAADLKRVVIAEVKDLNPSGIMETEDIPSARSVVEVSGGIVQAKWSPRSHDVIVIDWDDINEFISESDPDADLSAWDVEEEIFFLIGKPAAPGQWSTPGAEQAWTRAADCMAKAMGWDSWDNVARVRNS